MVWAVDQDRREVLVDYPTGRAATGNRLVPWYTGLSLTRGGNTLGAMGRALKADPTAWYRESQLDPPAGLAKRGESAPGTTGR